MSKFDLDLRAVEDHIDEENADGRIVLGVLDGETPPEEWVEAVKTEHVLVLCVDGNVNELASGFAREVKELGGNVVHFRGFLIVSPESVNVDTSRL